MHYLGKNLNQNQNLPYPVEENGKVSFKRDGEGKGDSNNTLETLLERLVAEFAKEYRLSNPEKSSPVFYIRKDPAL